MVPIAATQRSRTAITLIILWMDIFTTLITVIVIITAKFKSSPKANRQARHFNTLWIAARLLLASVAVLPMATSVYGQDGTSRFTEVPPETWVARAKADGDPLRGSIVFHQAALMCARCHATVESLSDIGPQLTRSRRDDGSAILDTELVEAILEPSKSIRDPYRTSLIRTTDGEVVTGMIRERTDTSVRVVTGTGESKTFSAEDIESLEPSKASLMPTGLVQFLPDDSSFVDLIRYLIEIREGGVPRAVELAPPVSMLAASVPEYESTIDHAGFLQSWNEESLERGRSIYQRVCANCHGTHDQLGSLPTALRFAEGKFKNGSDPYSMYRTLTHGFGFMPAQTWMVPSQKYDVIQYIQTMYMKNNPNVAQREIDASYLASLPVGNSRGPEPSSIEVWSAMDYGNALAHCYEVPGPRLNIAYKGIAIRVDPGPGGVARGNQWMLFDTDTLRWAAGWSHADDASNKNSSHERFIDWRDIQFNGEHGIHPRIVGNTVFANASGPGWASPVHGSFEDEERTWGRDGRRYGPLPKAWGQFRGLHTVGSQTIIEYRIGSTDILESPTQLVSNQGAPIFGRILNIEAHDHAMELRVADLHDEDEVPDVLSDGKVLSSSSVKVGTWRAGVDGDVDGLEWRYSDGQLRLLVPPSTKPQRFVLWCADSAQTTEFMFPATLDLNDLLQSTPPRWPERLQTAIGKPSDAAEFQIQALAWPENNPWLAQMRFTGIDFFSDGSLGVCTWDGDVWHVSEDRDQRTLQWQRIASGLYQPLGIVIRDDTVYLSCRDQIAILRDRNADGEADFIECFNNDHQVTEHFHEFAMGLQVDAQGNFYYAKSGRHALEAVVPQHGTLLRVSPDGESTEILATGFRAANGVCLNPDGSFIVTDQEGFWNPKNRINWVTHTPGSAPKFYGNMFGYHDVTDSSDSAMEPPLCWITNAFDRSPAELMWVNDPSWKELDGSLLNFSYGYGKIYLVLHEKVEGQEGLRQGGMISLAIPDFPTGVMRGRIHPQDHQLYTCGMFSWAGSATAPGGLYRIHKTDRPTTLPIGLSARTDGLHLTFAQPLDPASVQADRIQVKAWDLKRSARYGSDHYNERSLKIRSATLSPDGRSVRIDIDGLGPTWGMEIRYAFDTESGEECSGVIHNTIHALNPDR